MVMFSKIKLKYIYIVQESSHLTVDIHLDPIAASFIKKTAALFPFFYLLLHLQLEEAKHEKISAEDKLATTLYKLKVLIFRQNN